MSDSDQASLINKKGRIKAKLTRFKNVLEEDLEIENLKLRLKNIKPLLDEFEDIIIKLEEYEEVDRNRLEQEGELFELEYYTLLTKGIKKVEALSAPARAESNTECSNIESDNNNNILKLPNIQLPKFNGKYEKWNSFFEIFKAIIHDNQSLTDTQKFYYLQGTLQGEALEVVRSLELNGANYIAAIELLKNRFENKRLSIHNHLKSLFDSPIVNNNNYTLRNLLDNVLKNVKALESMGQPVTDWDTILIYLISTKLDYNNKKEWECVRAGKSDMPTFKEFINFLSDRCNLLEAINLSKT